MTDLGLPAKGAITMVTGFPSLIETHRSRSSLVTWDDNYQEYLYFAHSMKDIMLDLSLHIV